MALLKFKTHTPTQPLIWKEPQTGVGIFWTEKKSWETFYGEITAFCQRNNRPVPSDEEVQGVICKQLGAGWCVEAANFQPAPDAGRGGCTTCGGR